MAAIDSSPRGEGVFRAAADIAHRFGSRLFLFRAIHVPAELPPAAANVADDALLKFMRRQATEELRIVASVRPEIVCAQPVIGIGDPWRSIIATADELRADLIVLGNHGHTRLERMLGTTAAKVSNHAGCHVFIVHNR